MASVFDPGLFGETILPRIDKPPEAKGPSIPLSESSSMTSK